MRVRTLISALAGHVIDVPVHAAESGKASGFYLDPEDPMVPAHVPIPDDDPYLPMPIIVPVPVPPPNPIIPVIASAKKQRRRGPGPRRNA